MLNDEVYGNTTNLNKYLCEFVGTFLFIAVILFSNANPYIIVLFLLVLILLTIHISGSNFNPAVTLAMILTGHEKLYNFVPYVVAQLLGATLASMVWNYTQKYYKK